MTDLEKLKKTFDEIGVEYGENNNNDKVEINIYNSDSDVFSFVFEAGKLIARY